VSDGRHEGGRWIPKRTNTDEYERWRNLSIKNIAGNFALPDGRGLVEDCWVDVVPRVSCA